MTVEYLPVGIKCNLKCTYCYQEPMREAGNFSAPLDFKRVKQTLDKEGVNFALFGGEPLLASMSHLEEIFDYGFIKHGTNGIQTNGILITPAHIEMFKRYNVQVGVSIDGGIILNRARCSDVETTITIENIRMLRAAGISTSLITTIHHLNAAHMPELLDFFSEMESIGIRWVTLHILEIDNEETSRKLALTDMQNFQAFSTIYGNTRQSKATYSPFSDIEALLTRPNPSVICIWNNCDALTTAAVHGVNAAGDLTNCGRTNKDGVNWLKGDKPGFERYIALSMTDWADGGCKGCKYFFACKGQCPGTAIGGDWRNRTRDCQFWYMLMDYIRLDLEARGVQTLDFDAANHSFILRLQGQAEHGDTPHGDSHGDHTDKAGRSYQPTA